MAVYHIREEATFSSGSSIQVKLEFVNVGFSGGRKTKEPGEKSLEQGNDQQQTQQPTYGTWQESILATLVGSECSHHCTIPASLKKTFLQ